MSIEKVATKILLPLLALNRTVINDNWESGYEGSPFESEEDVQDFLYEDNERNQWYLSFKVQGVTHQELEKVITDVLGAPTRQHDRKDLPHKVNNWDIDNVMVVHVGDGVEFFEYFKRVSRK